MRRLIVSDFHLDPRNRKILHVIDALSRVIADSCW